MGSELNEVAVFAAVAVVGIVASAVVDASPWRRVGNWIWSGLTVLMLVPVAIALACVCLLADSDVFEDVSECD